MNLENLKVGIVTYGAVFQRVGGIQVQINETIDALRLLGLEVDVIDDRTEKLSDFDLIHVFAAAHANYVWVNEAKRQKTPVVLSPVFQPNYSKLQIGKILFFKWITSFLLSGIAGENIFSSIKYTHKAVKQADQVIVQSEKEKEVLRQIFELSPKKCTILSNGVSSKFFEASVSNNKEGYIFIPGAVYKHKNQYTAVKLACELGYDAVLAGEIIDTNYYNQIMSDFSNVKYAGVLPPQSESLLSFYKNATATMLLSHSETFGLVAIESLAAGTPVIMTKNTGLDSQALEHCLLKVDPELPLRAIEEARTFLMQDFIATDLRNSVKSYAWREIALKLEHVYKKVIMEMNSA